MNFVYTKRTTWKRKGCFNFFNVFVLISTERDNVLWLFVTRKTIQKRYRILNILGLVVEFSQCKFDMCWENETMQTFFFFFKQTTQNNHCAMNFYLKWMGSLMLCLASLRFITVKLPSLKSSGAGCNLGCLA